MNIEKISGEFSLAVAFMVNIKFEDLHTLDEDSRYEFSMQADNLAENAITMIGLIKRQSSMLHQRICQAKRRAADNNKKEER